MFKLAVIFALIAIASAGVISYGHAGSSHDYSNNGYADAYVAHGASHDYSHHGHASSYANHNSVSLHPVEVVVAHSHPVVHKEISYHNGYHY
ncbi:hypothetical protein FQA39_LY01847 [Lamprigera yunnana]|nr:hypothetical protein FQA39_LY01847 [Lamprigera yunnana]